MTRRSAVLLATLAVSGLAFLAFRVAVPSRVQPTELDESTEPTISIDDLVKQNPDWAPSTAPQLSKGFNAWMDTLPFGDNYHKQLAEAKEKQAFVEKERLNNPHFLLRRVEANNAYLKSRVDFLNQLVKQREAIPDPIEVDIVHPGDPGPQGPKGRFSVYLSCVCRVLELSQTLQSQLGSHHASTAQNGRFLTYPQC
jgi:hypothetical protein